MRLRREDVSTDVWNQISSFDAGEPGVFSNEDFAPGTKGASALAGSLGTAAQKKLLKQVKDVVDSPTGAGIVRTDADNRIINTIVQSERPIDALRTANLTPDQLKSFTAAERAIVFNKTQNKVGYLPAWPAAVTGVLAVAGLGATVGVGIGLATGAIAAAAAPFIAIPAAIAVVALIIFLILALIKSSPLAGVVSNKDEEAMASLLKATPQTQFRELTAKIDNLEELREQLRDQALSEVFSEIATANMSIEAIADDLRGASLGNVVSRLAQVAYTHGDHAPEALAKALKANGVFADIAPSIWNKVTIESVVTPNGECNIATKATYTQQWAQLTARDQAAAKTLLDALPVGAAKNQLLKIFTDNHNEPLFQARLQMREIFQTCVHLALENETRREELLKKIRDMRNKWTAPPNPVNNVDDIISEEFKLLEASGAIEKMLPFVYRKFSTVGMTDVSFVKSQQEWTKWASGKRAEDAIALSQIAQSLPADVVTLLSAASKKYHDEFEKTAANLFTPGAQPSIMEINRQIVQNQASAEGAATVLIRIRDTYTAKVTLPTGEQTTQGKHMAAEIAKTINFKGMLKNELTMAAKKVQTDTIVDIKSRAELKAEVTAHANVSRPRVEKLKDALKTLGVAGVGIAAEIEAAFIAGHNEEAYITAMDMEGTALRVVAANSGTKTDFLETIAKVTEKHTGSDLDIAEKVARSSEAQTAITRFFGTDINYKVQVPSIDGPARCETSNQWLDEVLWKDYLRTQLLSKDEWNKKFIADKKQDRADIAGLLSALPQNARQKVEAAFNDSHDNASVDIDKIANTALAVALSSIQNGVWGRWNDNWHSVHEVLVVIKEKYGEPKANELAWKLEDTTAPNKTIRYTDLVLPMIVASGPPTNRDEATLQERVKLQQEWEKKRGDQETQLKAQVKNLPMSSGAWASVKLDQADAETKAKRALWNAYVNAAP
jgi:hypothetical protein